MKARSAHAPRWRRARCKAEAWGGPRDRRGCKKDSVAVGDAMRQRFTSLAGYASASAQPTSMHAAKPYRPALCEWNVSRSQPMK